MRSFLFLVTSVGVIVAAVACGSYTASADKANVASDSYIAPADKAIKLECQCVLNKPLCQLKLWDQVSGAERHSWFQDAYLKKGQTYNLDEACYRKRDVANQGDSLCCTDIDEKDTIKRLFRGTPP